MRKLLLLVVLSVVCSPCFAQTQPVAAPASKPAATPLTPHQRAVRLAKDIRRFAAKTAKQLADANDPHRNDEIVHAADKVFLKRYQWRVKVTVGEMKAAGVHDQKLDDFAAQIADIAAHGNDFLSVEQMEEGSEMLLRLAAYLE